MYVWIGKGLLTPKRKWRDVWYWYIDILKLTRMRSPSLMLCIYLKLLSLYIYVVASLWYSYTYNFIQKVSFCVYLVWHLPSSVLKPVGLLKSHSLNYYFHSWNAVYAATTKDRSSKLYSPPIYAGKVFQ